MRTMPSLHANRTNRLPESASRQRASLSAADTLGGTGSFYGAGFQFRDGADTVSTIRLGRTL